MRVSSLRCVCTFVALLGLVVENVRADFASSVFALSPLAYWRFEDASSANNDPAVSSVNNGTYQGTYLDGSVNGAVALGASLPGLGNAAFFNNGVNTFTENSRVIAANSGLPAGTSDRTVIAWVKQPPLTNGLYHSVLDYGVPTFNQDIILGTENSSDQFLASQYGQAVFGPALDNNAWHFLALTVSAGGTWSIYVNGALVDSDVLPTATSLDNNAGPGGSDIMAIGSWYTGNLGGISSGWIGGIDEVAVFSTALLGAQIQQLYNAVPEPSSIGLAGVALLGLFGTRRWGTS